MDITKHKERTFINSKAANGRIDPVEGMAGDKVYIFAGTLDTTVKPGNAKVFEQVVLSTGKKNMHKINLIFLTIKILR